MRAVAPEDEQTVTRLWFKGAPDDPARNDPRTIIARKLDRAVESRRSLGCVKVNLQLRRGDEAVRGFYEALGWVEDPALSVGRLLKEP